MAKPLRVLLAEDVEDDAELLLRELRRVFAPQFERVETLEQMNAALAQSWDVVISDWSMPQLDAMQALAAVRAKSPELPFIIVSGTLGEESAVEAMRAGAQDYLLKGKFGRLNAVIERELADAADKRQARQTIAELSTPVLQIRDGLLIMPIIGVLDVQRTRQLTRSLLEAIRQRRAEAVVIDVTGVPPMDASSAGQLSRAIDAAGLLGAHVHLTGMSAENARALVELGEASRFVRCVGDLQSGIEAAERLVGYRVERASRSG